MLASIIILSFFFLLSFWLVTFFKAWPEVTREVTSQDIIRIITKVRRFANLEEVFLQSSGTRWRVLSLWLCWILGRLLLFVPGVSRPPFYDIFWLFNFSFITDLFLSMLLRLRLFAILHEFNRRLKATWHSASKARSDFNFASHALVVMRRPVDSAPIHVGCSCTLLFATSLQNSVVCQS